MEFYIHKPLAFQSYNKICMFQYLKGYVPGPGDVV
ncbi:hypothetical protein ABIC74_003240 [Mucilaginibacter rubeus]|jgi:hypothetical protein